MEEARTRTALRGTESDTSRAWVIVSMLFLFMLINFADKAVLGLAAVPIMRELGLSHTQFGLIGTSFFTLFSLGAVIIGFLVNRVATKWALAALVLIWSLCQLPILLPVGVAALVATRVILGLAEGPAYPVALHATYKWFPNERRAVPTSFIAIGAPVGTGVVAPLIVFIIATWSWHVAFGVLGAIGLVWCAAWLAISCEGPLASGSAIRGAPQALVPYRQLFGCRTIIGVQIAGFSAHWLMTLTVVWLPAFLNEGFGYSPLQAGWIMMLASLCQVVLLPTICAFSEKLERHGASSRLARGRIACACGMAAGLLTILLTHTDGSIATVVCAAVAFSIGNVIFLLGPVLVAQVTPVEQRGATLGVTNAVATLAGPFAPLVMGAVIDIGADPAAGFHAAYIIAGALVTLGAFVGFLLIDPEADLARFAKQVGPRGRPMS